MATYNLLWNPEFRLSKAHAEYVKHHIGVNSLTRGLLKVKRQAFPTTGFSTAVFRSKREIQRAKTLLNISRVKSLGTKVTVTFHGSSDACFTRSKHFG